MRNDELILYKNFKHKDIFEQFCWLFTHSKDNGVPMQEKRAVLFACEN